MEFLLGRTLSNNIINLAADPIVRRVLERERWDLEDILEQEPDAGSATAVWAASPRVSSAG